MKVDFYYTERGDSLCVKTSEFNKSKNNEIEMSSIKTAVRAFYYWKTLGQWTPDIPKMLDAIYKQSRKNSGTIIFTFEGEMPKEIFFNVYLVANNGVIKILDACEKHKD